MTLRFDFHANQRKQLVHGFSVILRISAYQSSLVIVDKQRNVLSVGSINSEHSEIHVLNVYIFVGMHDESFVRSSHDAGGRAAVR